MFLRSFGIIQYLRLDLASEAKAFRQTKKLLTFNGLHEDFAAGPHVHVLAIVILMLAQAVSQALERALEI